MTSPHIVMLLSREYGPDVRAQKEAHTLSLAGCRVSIVAWDRQCRQPVHILEDTPAVLRQCLTEIIPGAADRAASVAITHLPIPAGYRTGKQLLVKMPLFGARAWGELRRLQPTVVHAHDLDTLPLAYLYARAYGAALVYDVREYYPGMVRASVGPRLSQGLEWLDRFLTPRADAVLTVGERLADRLRGLGGHVWVVHNSQPLPDLPALDETAARVRQQIGIPDGKLLVVYVGYLNPERLVEPLLAAVPALPDVWLAIGGTGPQTALVERAAADCDRIRALGWLPLDEVPAVVRAADVVYYGLNTNDPNSHYFMPNLAFFALATGRPLLVTPVGEIADVVQREGCGVVLNSSTPVAVQQALQHLCDSRVRATLTNCACQLGQQKYHWGCAARQLLDAYGSLPDVKNCLGPFTF
jgi:glycosyltransferase involved in cell wall biosynthesis